MRHKRLTKRFTATALCAVLGFTGAMAGAPAMTSYAAKYEKVDGAYRMPDGTAIDGVIARGIDVSRWQGNIDWNTVAANDVAFVMLGTRSKGAVDPYFHANVKGASDAGIRVGAYIYSLATTPEMAVAEADFVLDLVKDYPISFPIAFDAEDSETLGTLPPEEVAEIVNAFCQRIESAGYYPIVYANDNWLANKIDMTQIPYDVWVARYEVKHKYADPIMWQATSTGSVAGIAGNVDIDFLYKDLTPCLPGNLWRTIGDKTYYYKNYVMQKDSWVDDGTGWFYMNSDGLISTGWLEKQGLHYYLDDVTGRMTTGWRQLDGKTYFFNGSGAMSTGWLDDGGARYYLNEDGSMATGWLNAPEGRYYLDLSTGKMATGWLQLGDKWYFLQESGIMATGWLDNNGARYFLNQDGTMATGWHADGASRYFLSESGQMTVGWKQLDGAWYYFNPNGEMASGWIQPDGNWYYLNADGVMQNGWQTVDGYTYYLSLNSGRMTTGWRNIDGYWYYFNGSGVMVTGLTEIDGKLYYLNPADGRMAVSTVLDFDGVDYAVDESGVCVKVEETPAEGGLPGADGNNGSAANGGNIGNSGGNGNSSVNDPGTAPDGGNTTGNSGSTGGNSGGNGSANNGSAGVPTVPAKEYGPGV